MAYYLRFTDTAEQDLERGTSIHAHDDESENTVLDGLCGYDLESWAETDDLEEIFEEIEDRGLDGFQFAFVGQPVIFEGTYSNDSDNVPDGDCFHPDRIIVTL